MALLKNTEIINEYRLKLSVNAGFKPGFLENVFMGCNEQK